MELFTRRVAYFIPFSVRSSISAVVSYRYPVPRMEGHVMPRSLAEKLSQDGYAVVEDFLFDFECEELMKAGRQFYSDLPNSEHITIFSTAEHKKHQIKEKYFMQSNDKIRCFYEYDAVDSNGRIKVRPDIALNKVGHALHLLHPLFRYYTYSNRVKKVLQELGFEEPAVVQSMYIYKNPGIGGEVAPHQDATYLYTEPIPPVGFWIALEDANVNNGCLWVIQGSQDTGIHRRLIRSVKDNTDEVLIYNTNEREYPISAFRSLPVKKGSLVLLHGRVVHKSAHNMSREGRPVYTFHVIEKRNNNYSQDNWLQEGKQAPFLNMYTTDQLSEDLF